MSILTVFLCLGAARSDPTGRARAAVQRAFGPDLVVASERNPHVLAGDYNGDGYPDVAIVVRPKGAVQLRPGVVVWNPWKKGGQAFDPARVKLALAVIHGTKEGWDSPAPRARFLISDPEFFSSPIWASPQSDLMGTVPRRQGAPGAKGDSARLFTEAGIDIFLYWDGRAYRLHWPKENP